MRLQSFNVASKIIITVTEGPQILHESRSHLEILDARRLTGRRGPTKNTCYRTQLCACTPTKHVPVVRPPRRGNTHPKSPRVRVRSFRPFLIKGETYPLLLVKFPTEIPLNELVQRFDIRYITRNRRRDFHSSFEETLLRLRRVPHTE